ncbi:MAG TPA: SpoIIE family protein phosphatase [Anaerolineales bacterium]|jgi:serine phosphatase RsbU (regulator of sigma subunit)|nr:stage II sporulation protein E [Anaerolineae bacterium]HRJ56240.1 SpoIIE family protein phosphatase [Anaerolineales bacterium]HRK90581.1 SpoIIE family protein phosphatase [Anaerolineales bacterium]
MELQIAVAKVNKYAVSESGDTLEVVERPTGGLSVVLADGQTSGRGAKAVSMMVVRKVIGLIAEGVRDGAAARAASDALFADRAGKVTCTLNIASVDLHSKTIVLTRNNPAPMYICRGEEIDAHNEESISLGTSRNVRPIITELGIEPGLTVIIFSDGISHAGERRGQPFDVRQALRSLMDDQDPSPQQIADTLLAQAVQLDDNRPADDVSVVVLKVTTRNGDDVRRMNVRLPINA